MKNPAPPAMRTMSGPTMNRARETGWVTGTSVRGCDGLSNHGRELRGLHESDDAEVSLFLAISSIERDRRRSEDAEVLEQFPIDIVIRRDVGLEFHGVRKRALYVAHGERVVFHLLARHAPVGVEIEHHGFSASLGCVDFAREICERLDAFEFELRLLARELRNRLERVGAAEGGACDERDAI